MIDSTALTADLQAEVRKLEDDLRVRADEVDEVRALVTAEWRTASDAGRTAHDLETWREGLLTQVAVAWVLGCVFVRFCEDNGLIERPMLAGPGERGRVATSARMDFFVDHPLEGDRGWLLQVFETARELPGLSEVFAHHNPLWLFGPTDDAAGSLGEFFAGVSVESGELVHDFTDPQWSTRFLGDLYQDLSESARKTYALLQTPDFVEEFILDHTLEPAIEEFGLDDFRCIDPACGSGHFVLGMFARLFERWQLRAPGDGSRANAERALNAVYGVDLNPFAASIARFRLLVAALRAADVKRLAEAPWFTTNVAVGDALLHGPAPGQQTIRQIEEQDAATRHLFATEDGELIGRILRDRYHAVVANPPYVTPKDAAARELYRARYRTCHGKYALSVPFMERLFDLARRGSNGDPAGFVGQITANSFIKRAFGKKLIEEFLASEVDLQTVVDTSGAYIPGHGTPTVILFGRARSPVGEDVAAVLGIRGEPSAPDVPSDGQVWQSILRGMAEPGFENEFVSASRVERLRLRGHPWSLQGGAAPDLMLRMEANSPTRLGAHVTDVGITAVTGEDEVFLVAQSTVGVDRIRLEETVDLVTGDQIRDWRCSSKWIAVRTFDSEFEPLSELSDRLVERLWPYRAGLSRRKRFGTPLVERGSAWFEWQELYPAKLRTRMTISVAAMATHNHFQLDRDGTLFNRTAPVIKLPDGSSERDHLEVLGFLNSAIACFWMKQVFQCRGSTVDSKGARQSTLPYEDFYDFGTSELKQLPMAEGSTIAWSESIDRLAAAPEMPGWEAGAPTSDLLAVAKEELAERRRQLVALQEELDWRCLYLYGVTDEDLSLGPSEVPGIELGQRAFEIVLARQVATGAVSTEWFRRHGSIPSTEVPSTWSAVYRSVVERRMELIASDRLVNLVNRPEFKRRWNWDDWDKIEQQELRSWLLDRLESPDLWAAGALMTTEALADRVRADEEFISAAALYSRVPDIDVSSLVADLTSEESVPFLAAHRYKDGGLRKRAAWERTWDLQRRADDGSATNLIPVPPKYVSADFRKNWYWRLRGKLDVPKERFISYPGAERGDGTSVLGWAGWDHLERARALAGWIEDRRSNDGWEQERLVPLLAGVAELVPWLKQWHNEPDPVMGERMGDFFAAYVDAEAHSLGVSPDDLAAWRPPATTRGRKKKS